MSQVDYDVTSHVTLFCRALRDHGLMTGPGESADALRSMTLVDLMTPGSVYWALRSVLVSARHEIPTFDRLFERFWDFDPPPQRATRRGAGSDLPGRGRARASTPSADRLGDTRSDDVLVRLMRTGASTLEAHRSPDLSALASHRAGRVACIAGSIVDSLRDRPSRRLRRHRRGGYIDMRGVLRKSLSHGGDPVDLPRRTRILRKQRLLLLLDASGSMNRHAHLMLELSWAIAQHTRRIEAFAFSTSVSRISKQLRSATYVEALRSVEETVDHWSGGTKIGESLGHINTRYPGFQDRYTTALLVSDGWDTGDPHRLSRELRRMRRRVRRLVWLNPLIGSEGYEQATRSLVAAADHVDHFASIRDVDRLTELPALLAK